MTAIPEPTATPLSDLIDQAHESRLEKPRPHMGASQLGHHCDRYLWLSFRWAFRERFPGRILRLFRRGHNEESTVVSDLRAAGLHVTDTGSMQARVDFGGHVSGSIDGIILYGVPEAPKTSHILEIKTHSDKSFRDLRSKGVSTSKPIHWAQMQVYMLGKKLSRALYVAVNKNDDSIHIERVRINKEAAEALVERGHRISVADTMPEPCMNASPTWYQCKFCPAYKMCHESAPATESNCRTCAHSTAEADGSWTCEKWGAVIPVDAQYNGCEAHVIHPDLVPWKLDSESSTETIAVWDIGGHLVKNGDPSEGKDIYTTKEMLANASEIISNDPMMKDLRVKFDARIEK